MPWSLLGPWTTVELAVVVGIIAAASEYVRERKPWDRWLLESLAVGVSTVVILAATERTTAKSVFLHPLWELASIATTIMATFVTINVSMARNWSPEASSVAVGSVTALSYVYGRRFLHSHVIPL